MKALPLASVVLLVVSVLYQTNLGNCYWIRLPAVEKLNQVIKSIFSSSKLNEIGPTAAASVLDDADDDEKKQRQLSFSKNVYVNKTTSQSTLTVTVVSTTVVSTSQFCARFINNVFGGCRRRRQILNANEEMALPLEPSRVVNRQDMTPIISDDRDSLPSNGDLIQPSMTDGRNNDEDDSYHYRPSGRIFGYYFYSFYSPVYVYLVSTSTSYVYTTTKTFYVTVCIPSSFSYPIC